MSIGACIIFLSLTQHNFHSGFPFRYQSVTVSALHDQDPGTPEPDFHIPENEFRPPSDDELIDLTAHPAIPTGHHPAPPHSVATGRHRLPSRAHESLCDRVRRTSCDIAVRRESKKKYAVIHKQDKFKCKLCGVFLNSAASREAHRKGKRHKAKE